MSAKEYSEVVEINVTIFLCSLEYLLFDFLFVQYFCVYWNIYCFTLYLYNIFAFTGIFIVRLFICTLFFSVCNEGQMFASTASSVTIKLNMMSPTQTHSVISFRGKYRLVDPNQCKLYRNCYLFSLSLTVLLCNSLVDPTQCKL